MHITGQGCAVSTAVIFEQDKTDGSDPVQAAALLAALPFPSLQSLQSLYANIRVAHDMKQPKCTFVALADADALRHSTVVKIGAVSHFDAQI